MPQSQFVPWPTVTCIDSTGRVLWRQHYGQAYDLLRDIAPLPDGSYALAGWQARLPAGQNRLDFNAWWLRLDGRDGTLIRERTFGIGPDNETFRTVAPTPDGGLLLGGSNYPNVYAGPSGSAVEQGLLLKVDSLDQVQWRQAIVSANPQGQNGCRIDQVLPLPQPGAFVVAGFRLVPFTTPPGGGPLRIEPYYVARYQATATGAAPVWEFQGRPAAPNASVALGPGGTATALSTGKRTPNAYTRDLLYTRLGGLPPVWQPTYCQQAPQAQAAHQRPRPDSLLLYELSTAGPPLAGLVRWRWQVGQPGQPYYRVVSRDTAVAGPLRLGFAAGQVPPAGTPVTLTVTNNLGCQDTATLYPFGPLGTAAARAGAGLLLWPNPAGAGAGAVRLRWPGLAAGGGAVAGELRDALGRLVREGRWPAAALAAGGAALEVAGLPAGLYVLRLQAAGATATARLVLE